MSHRFATIIIVAALLAGGGVARAATTWDVQVGGIYMFFSPQTVNISVGDTVRWTNSSGAQHSVTSDDNGATFNHDPASSFVFTHTFDTAGTFGYHCVIHGSPGGGMYGTVVVT